MLSVKSHDILIFALCIQTIEIEGIDAYFVTNAVCSIILDMSDARDRR